MNLLPHQRIKARATPREGGHYRLTISRHPSGRLAFDTRLRGQPTAGSIAHYLVNLAQRPRLGARVRSFFRPGELEKLAALNPTQR